MVNSPDTPTLDRRQLMRTTGLVSLTIMTPLGRMKPAAAQTARTPLLNLTDREAASLEALAEALVPGATDAGIARYIDAQLISDHPLLMLHYLDWPSPPAAFYRDSIRALDALAASQSAGSFADLAPSARTAIAGQLLSGMVEGWAGPPAFLVYFALRADAVDVVFGTPEGFATLGVPYMPHIQPPEGWS